MALTTRVVRVLKDPGCDNLTVCKLQVLRSVEYYSKLCQQFESLSHLLITGAPKALFGVWRQHSHSALSSVGFVGACG